MSTQGAKSSAQADGLPTLDVVDVQRLNELATAKLAEIVRRGASGENGWRGYDMAEIIAAREILDQDVTPIAR